MIPAGSRYQAYDLVVDGHKREVKKLSPAGKSFDRRFKVGGRGVLMYGRRDSQLRRAAVNLELDHKEWKARHGMSDVTISGPMYDQRLIDDIHRSRHGKRNIEWFISMVERSGLASIADVIDRPEPIEILKGYSDLDGIYFAAGSYFRLVRREEFETLLGFDSASAEGVKLRYLGELPRL